MDRDPVSVSSLASGEGSVSLTVQLPEILNRHLSERARSLGQSPEECLLRALSEDLAASEFVMGPVRAEIGKLSEKSDRLMETIREEFREIDDRNRRAYEALAQTLKPSRKEWGLIGGGAAVVAVLLLLLAFVLGKGPAPGGGSPSLSGKPGVSLPSQLGEKDKYVYFVGRWYLGVRDRMSTKERLFLENYLKPFDNFDEDLKARKAAGL
ncbi:MAG: hypothetical protein M1313_06390 [Nitrospirae bacterium]|nr:hypothetical protein [Nitrospirota bacterium]